MTCDPAPLRGAGGDIARPAGAGRGRGRSRERGNPRRGAPAARPGDPARAARGSARAPRSSGRMRGLAPAGAAGAAPPRAPDRPAPAFGCTPRGGWPAPGVGGPGAGTKMRGKPLRKRGNSRGPVFCGGAAGCQADTTGRGLRWLVAGRAETNRPRPSRFRPPAVGSPPSGPFSAA